MEEAPEKIIAITGMTGAGEFIALSNRGLIRKYSPQNLETWETLPLPPGFEPGGEHLVDPVNHGGRMPKGYGLFKDNRSKMFYWERQEPDQFQSEAFEHMEGAIAAARTDHMVRHPPKPPPPTLEKK
jgi:hypothetical protein